MLWDVLPTWSLHQKFTSVYLVWRCTLKVRETRGPHSSCIAAPDVQKTNYFLNLKGCTNRKILFLGLQNFQQQIEKKTQKLFWLTITPLKRIRTFKKNWFKVCRTFNNRTKKLFWLPLTSNDHKKFCCRCIELPTASRNLLKKYFESQFINIFYVYRTLNNRLIVQLTWLTFPMLLLWP